MSYLINNQQKINDVIFANRNKAYGAYAIRASYGNTIIKSFAIMLFGFGMVMSAAYYMNNKNNDGNSKLIPNCQLKFKDSIYTVQINVEPQPETVAPVKTEQNNANTATTASTIIVETTTLEAKPSESVTGTGTSTNSTDNPVGPSTGSVAGTGSITNTPSVNIEPTHFWDSAPEFEGGLKALYAFVGSKLKYPEEATDKGKEGTVYVKFIVDQNGKVGNLTLQNNAGYGFDEEALRVVALIPNFKTPGKVNGQAVKVYYQLPIKFKMK